MCEITSVRDGERCKKGRAGEEEERLDLNVRNCTVIFVELDN